MEEELLCKGVTPSWKVRGNLCSMTNEDDGNMQMIVDLHAMQIIKQISPVQKIMETIVLVEAAKHPKDYWLQNLKSLSVKVPRVKMRV
ncbi:unnamed protein product [Sphenostylis stenocarpa]|uniref:Uncharacterized protein n=1 Tax=Sphenostylis stenocarpa TaxID=92480 RepID=A0AA86VZ71_9FABA|nr:unnamed protein product [Sphenostylis stenocarpa]